MSDEEPKSSIPRLWRSIGTATLILAGTVVASLATPTGELLLPTKLLAALGTSSAGILAAGISLTWYLWKQTSDSRLRMRFEHEATTGISVERDGPNKGRKVCSKCLHETPARIFPLYDNEGFGRWYCHQCRGCFKDAGCLAREKAQAEEKRKNPKPPTDRTYAA